ncbi:urease subunit gamma [Streptomyces violascens]|uniref:urease subunit gamma n=1 Tax=Streptomyces violascens TaxID=67381 RepID=UPI003689FBFC
MNLAPREIDKLYVYIVADLARKRRERGLKLNYSEAVAVISEAILEGARESKTVAECMEVGKAVVGAADVMDGVRDMCSLIQVEATFPDGTKLVSCHDPVGA